MKIGEKIRTIRELKGITAKDMAAELGMTPTGYSKIERDEVDINTEKIEKISNRLGIKPYELLSFDEKIVFNNYSTTEYYSAGMNTVNNNFPPEVKKLYDLNIKLLEEKVELLTSEKNTMTDLINLLKAEIEQLKSKIK